MSDTSNAPSTASELAEHIEFVLPADLAAYYRTEPYHRCRKDQEPWPCLVVRQAAQLQEAGAQLLTLREAADRLLLRWQEGKHVEAGFDDLVRALNSTAEYNKQALARIREEAVKPWREALATIERLRNEMRPHDVRAVMRLGDALDEAIEYACNVLPYALASQSKSDTE